MDIRGWFRGFLPRRDVETRGPGEQTTPAPVAAKIASWLTDQPQYPPSTPEVIVREGLGKNPLIDAGLRLITGVFCQPPLRVRDRRTLKVIEDHPIEALLRAPEPGVTQNLFWARILSDWMSSNPFLEVVLGKRSGLPRQLWRLPPNKVAVVPGKQRLVDRYLFEVDGVWYRIPEHLMIHFRSHNPLNDWFGQPQLQTAVRAIVTDNEASDFVKVTLQNLAVPSLVLKWSGPSDLTEEKAKEIKRRWKENHSGPRRGDIGVIDKMDIETVGMTLEQLAFPELSSQIETRVLMALGGAALVYMVGAKSGMDRSTFANYADAQESLIDHVVSPLWDLMDDWLSLRLLPFYPRSEHLECFFDTSKIPALEGRRMRRLKEASEAVGRGMVEVDEGRVLAGLPPLGRRLLYLPSTVEPYEVGPGGTLTPAEGTKSPLNTPPAAEDAEVDAEDDFDIAEEGA